MNRAAEKIKETVDTILDSLEQDFGEVLSALVDKQVNCLLLNTSISTWAEFLNPRLGSNSFLVDLYSENEEIKGSAYLSVDFKEACWVSVAMNGQTEANLNEKLTANTYNENDVDAISELGNQLTGKLNTALKPIAKKPLHFTKKNCVVMDGSDNAMDKIPNEGGDVITAKFSVSAINEEAGFIYLVIPIDFAASVTGIPLVDADTIVDEKLRKIILMCQELSTKEEETYHSVAEKIAAQIVTCNFDSSVVDSPDIQDADLIFVDSLDDPNEGIAMCKQIIEFSGKNKKLIILTARNITKPVLEKAISTGISDVIVKPTTPSILLQKVQANIG